MPRSSAYRPRALTVSALTHRIKQQLEAQPDVWVSGEISGLKEHRSGHVYFTLKDEGARLDAMVWSSAVPRIKFHGGDGDQVFAFGRLNVYAPQGSYKLIVEQMLPAGDGAAQAALEALKAKLAAEGLFDPQRKRPLPFLPRRVGVVTSASGAALHDIRTVLHRRAPQVRIVLCPAQVQGPRAAAEVASGVRRLARAPGVEVVIVGRGGGSREDLSAFNDERVARAIAECPVPVVSAVGHASDRTLADLVADRCAATPSEAAEAVVPVRDDLLSALATLSDRLDRALGHVIQRRRQRVQASVLHLRRGLAFDTRRVALQRLEARTQRAAGARLATARGRLERLVRRTRAAHPAARLARSRRALGALVANLHRAPDRLLRARREQLIALTRRLERRRPDLGAARQRLEALSDRLATAGAAQAETRRARLATLLARLDALSPLAVLARGYSITLLDGRAVHRYDEVEIGDALQIRLHRGRLAARVEARAEGEETE